MTPCPLRPSSAVHPSTPTSASHSCSVSPTPAIRLQPLIDFFEAILKFFHDTIGIGWGFSIIVADDPRPRVPAAADVQAVPLDAAAGPSPAGDEEAAGEAQERQGAAEPGDDEVLPGEQGQSVRLVPPDGGAVPGLHLAVLHAAHRPPARHLPGDQRRRRCTRRSPDALRRRRRVVVPVHPGPDGQGHRQHAGHPDHPLRRLAAVLDAADVDDDGQDAADDLPRAAVRLRHVRHPVPGRPARLLDHDEHAGRSCSRRSSASASARCVHRSAGDWRRVAVRGGGGGGSTAAASRDETASARDREPVGTSEAVEPKGARRHRPPAPPRKKKKRSGRRR